MRQFTKELFGEVSAVVQTVGHKPIIFGLIITVVFFFAWLTAVAFSSSEQKDISKSILGQSFILPKTDARGIPIVVKPKRIIVSMGCFSCAPDEVWRGVFKGHKSNPIIIVTPYALETLPKPIRTDRENVLIIVDAKNKIAPFGFIDYAPFGATVDERGIVIDIVATGDSALDYLKRNNK